MTPFKAFFTSWLLVMAAVVFRWSDGIVDQNGGLVEWLYFATVLGSGAFLLFRMAFHPTPPTIVGDFELRPRFRAPT